MVARNQYRAGIETDDAIHVCFLAVDGACLCGQIIDLSIDGVSLNVRHPAYARHRSALEAGQKVELEFPSTLLNIPIRASAVVRHRRAEGGGWRYGLQFKDRGQFETRLGPVFHKLFNRRRSRRVEPDRDMAVEVASPDLRVNAPMIDISRTGVAVSAPTELEQNLKGIDSISLSLPVPGSRKRVTLNGIIRTRKLDRDARVRYGIEFEHTLPNGVGRYEEHQLDAAREAA